MNYLIESNFIPYSIILLIYASLSHGLILLNNGLYWDAFMVDSWQRRKDWPTMKRYLSEVGMPIMYYVYKWNSYFPNRIFASKLLAFISIYVSSVLVYAIATYFNFLNSEQALLLSLLFLSYTGYHMMVDTVVGLQYTFPIAVFYTAVFLALYSNNLYGADEVLIKIISGVLFFYSFNANSILVYFFGFLSFYILFENNWQIRQINYPLSFLQNIGFIILPFLYWTIKEKFTPRHGHCADYNRISLNLFQITLGFFQAIRFSLEIAIINPVLFVLRKQLIFLIILIVLGVNNYVSINLIMSVNQALFFVILGAVLFFLAVIPYILVGQPISFHGWTTKNAMLVHLPSSLIVYGVISLTIKDPVFFQSILLFYLLCTCVFNVRNYFYYLAVFIKDHSWLSKLKANKSIEEISIFQVIDNHSLIGDLTHKPQDYRPVYLHYMFDWIWKTEPSRFGIREYDRRECYSKEELLDAFEKTTIPYAIEDKINLNSKQARIIIKNGINNRHYLIIALKYIIAFKIKKYNGRYLENVLKEAADIEIELL